jgi:pyrroline-5-carboxylate reductase
MRKKGLKISIIGAGNMGKALIKGSIQTLIEKNIISSSKDIIATRRNEEELNKLENEFSIDTTTDNKKAVSKGDVIILAVKPQTLLYGVDNQPSVLDEISPVVDSSKLLISIAAGVTIQAIQSRLNEGAHVIRAMPNTPLEVREGVIAISRGKNASDENVALAKEIFTATGTVVTVEEEVMDAVTGLSGSGPAYIFLIIEALSDAGVKMGLPRKTSLKLAVQTVLGAAKMVLETEKHPAELKDKVTSPGGTTIAGLHVLEECAVRSALIKAVEEAARRSTLLGGGDKG